MLTLFRGDTQTLKISVTDSGQIFDLTGYNAKFTMRINENSPTVSIEKSITTIENPELGIIQIDLTESDTKNLAPNKYVFDVEIRNADSSKVYTVIKSTIEIIADITR
jgi:hypothetical protein